MASSRDLVGSSPDVRGPAASDVAAFTDAFADAAELATLSAAARRLLATAAALFLRRGASSTSVRDITGACGLSPGALYNHFESKDQLLYVLVRYGHDALDRRIGDALRAAGPDPVERTAAYVRAYVLGHLVHPQLAQVVRREYLHLSAQRYDEIVRQRRRSRDRLAALLADGHAAGSFRLMGRAADAHPVAIMVLDMCSRTSEWYDRSRSEPPERVAERYVTGALRLAGGPEQQVPPMPGGR